MPKPIIRNGLILATALAVTAIGSVATSGGAYASHAGSGTQLTSSNGGTSIAFAGKSALAAGEPVSDASWSPDGSRAVFVTTDGELDSVRYNDGADLWFQIDPDNTVVRNHPTWSGNGSTIFWAEKPSAGAPWQIESSSSSYGWGYSRTSPNDGNDYTKPDGGPGDIVVAQRNPDSGGSPTGQADAVEIGNGTATLIIAEAASPSVSPSGAMLAFVRTDGTYNQIFTSDMSGGNVTQITNDAFNHDNPTWSPESSTLAFTRTDNNAVYKRAATLGTGASALATGLTGLPAYQPSVTDKVVKLAGQDRFGTAIKISQQLWATAGATDTRQVAQSVTLSRSDSYADAVSGSALAAAKHGPLLMTASASLTPVTQDEIVRVLGTSDPSSKTVYLLGGTGAISTDVQNAITALGYNVSRLAGQNRFLTSIAIANAIDPDPNLVLAATGVDFPDALGAGAAAGSYDTGDSNHAVVVLTNGTSMPTDTKAYVDDWYATHGSDINYGLFGIGGQAATALSNYANAIPVAGHDRYETAIGVAEEFFGGPASAGVTIGTNWPDALAGGAFLATINAPLLLTDTSTTLNGDAEFVLDTTSGSINTGFIFGGGVTSSTANQVGVWISGSGSYTAVNGPATQSAQALSPLSQSAGVKLSGSSTKHFTAAQLKARAATLKLKLK